MNTPDSLNPALQQAHEAGAAAHAEHQKAKAALEVALGCAIKSVNNLLLAERDRLFASGESAADVSSYFAMMADNNSAEWSGGPASSRNILEVMTRKAALRLASDPHRKALWTLSPGKFYRP